MSVVNLGVPTSCCSPQHFTLFMPVRELPFLSFWFLNVFNVCSPRYSAICAPLTFLHFCYLVTVPGVCG